MSGHKKMGSQEGCDSAPCIKPIFALGGSVSGYASMGSIESLSGDLKRVSKVWSTEDVIEETVKDDYISKHLNATNSSFKSSFAKELEEENHNQSMRMRRYSLMRQDHALQLTQVVNRDSDRSPIAAGDQDTTASETIDELSKVKLENKILKLKLKSYNQDNEKYKKLQCEIEQLTWQLNKVPLKVNFFETLTKEVKMKRMYKLFTFYRWSSQDLCMKMLQISLALSLRWSPQS